MNTTTKPIRVNVTVDLTITKSSYNQACTGSQVDLESYLAGLFRGAAFKDEGITIQDIEASTRDDDDISEFDLVVLLRRLTRSQRQQYFDHIKNQFNSNKILLDELMAPKAESKRTSIESARLRLNQIEALINLLLCADDNDCFSVEHSDVITSLWTIYELAEGCLDALQEGSDHE